MDVRIEITAKYIKENLHKNLKSAELARSLNLSASRLNYLFKAEMGITLTQYLKTLRLERAKDLGETTFLSVKQIMNAVGFSDESHFARDFKKKYGESPATYQQRYVRATLGDANLPPHAGERKAEPGP
jgi:transcriptional regulator GlxA family with amidase domain